jgi:hypothetical protein
VSLFRPREHNCIERRHRATYCCRSCLRRRGRGSREHNCCTFHLHRSDHRHRRRSGLHEHASHDSQIAEISERSLKDTIKTNINRIRGTQKLCAGACVPQSLGQLVQLSSAEQWPSAQSNGHPKHVSPASHMWFPQTAGQALQAARSSQTKQTSAQKRDFSATQLERDQPYNEQNRMSHRCAIAGKRTRSPRRNRSKTLQGSTLHLRTPLSVRKPSSPAGTWSSSHAALCKPSLSIKKPSRGANRKNRHVRGMYLCASMVQFQKTSLARQMANLQKRGAFIVQTT